MRFHVLGVGSIGSLIAFHLRRNLRHQRAQLKPSDPRSTTTTTNPSSSSSSHSDQRFNSQKRLFLIPPQVKKALPPPRTTSVTLQLRKSRFVTTAERKLSNSIVIEHEGVRDVEPDFIVESSSATSSLSSTLLKSLGSRRGFSKIDSPVYSNPSQLHLNRAALHHRQHNPSADKDGGISVISQNHNYETTPGSDPIDSLIVTTKADSTLSAFNELTHRIHPHSTIVLLQNGMGVLDLLLRDIFKDPESRPNFILATTTHGCWSKGPLDTVHSSFGSIHFGIVPSPRGGALGFERPLTSSGSNRGRRRGGSIRSEEMEASAFGRGGSFAYETLESNRGNSNSSPTTLELDPNAIPDLPSTQTLRYTVSTLLSLPLDVHWEPISKFQKRTLRKLAVNACINPITALVDCRNGELFKNENAVRVMRKLCHEIGMVLEARGKRKTRRGKQPLHSLSVKELIVRNDSTGQPMLDPALLGPSLFKEAERVTRLTSSNWSSMHADVHKSRRNSTEIDFINGYISALGRGYGIPTPYNDMMVDMIKMKSGRLTRSQRSSRI
ncbi:hypothetical protein IE53DRAFT_318075 [Violaceomyces palustris]|uniref:Uncharacterized protein n=1 Tax=Violaceomyces palustris TaxID=1673888 RepID=A0ACD0NTW9_9BASI|nr:hypothetical protein IE53DRAFT_318075 [Violaceomyces palustris]